MNNKILPLYSSDLENLISANPELFRDIVRPVEWLITRCKPVEPYKKLYHLSVMCPVFQDVDTHLTSMSYVRSDIGPITEDAYRWIKAHYPKHWYVR